MRRAAGKAEGQADASFQTAGAMKEGGARQTRALPTFESELVHTKAVIIRLYGLLIIRACKNTPPSRQWHYRHPVWSR